MYDLLSVLQTETYSLGKIVLVRNSKIIITKSIENAQLLRGLRFVITHRPAHLKMANKINYIITQEKLSMNL